MPTRQYGRTNSRVENVQSDASATYARTQDVHDGYIGTDAEIEKRPKVAAN